MLKSEILAQAINRKVKVRFYYDMREIILDPCFIFYEKDCTRMLYGRSPLQEPLQSYSIKRISNLRVLPNDAFHSAVPFVPLYN